MTRLRVAVGLLLVVTLGGPVLSGCAKAGSVRTGAADDATLTTNVKTVFINEMVGGFETIDVDTSNGVVTLSGRVDTKEQEARAIELAGTVRGVTVVKSTLQIQP
ncbi:MAG: BON domain-containing protein [Acidobacteriota bacterium]|nr:BON domain-containing protein [Acidobacteriota bacterium]